MIKKIFNKIFDRPKTIADNESLVRLIQLTHEDSTFRKNIENILYLEPSKRTFAITKIVMSMHQNKEPKEIIEAFSALKDDRIAKEFLEYIKT